MSNTAQDHKTGADIESRLPENYPDAMRTFTLVSENGRTLAQGVQFSDGRVVVHRHTGPVLMERYSSASTMTKEYDGRARVKWCQQKNETDCPRRFLFIRNADVSGFSGTGIAVEGVEFSSGEVALVWLGTFASMVFWPSVEHAITVHGHAGATVLHWLDDQPSTAPTQTRFTA